MNIETMKRENDELTDLFRSRLDGSEMTVREGFWNELSSSVAAAQRQRKLVLMRRMAAAASVLLILGVSSAAFWIFSPKEEIEQAFTQVAATAGAGSLHGDQVRTEFTPPVQARPILQKQVARQMATPAWNEEEEDSISVTFSMTFSITTTTAQGTPRQVTGFGKDYWPTSTGDSQTTVSDEQKDTKNVTAIASDAKPRKRAIKVAAGTALPADGGKYKMPVSAAVTMEQPLGKKFSVEAGVQYSNLRSDGQNLHYIGIPVKMNYTLASTSKFDWYATVGGVADKCIAGAPDNSEEPIQLALTAGVGMNYKLNEKIALFAEPGFSYHFKTSSALETVRTERPANLNLICGIRMTY